MSFFNRQGWVRALLLAATVLMVCVGASWGQIGASSKSWEKVETKDKWGDVDGYYYMQEIRVDGKTSYGSTGKWTLGLGYSGDDNFLIGIARENGFSDRIPLPFSLLFGGFDGNITVTVSLRDENKNTKDFYGSYMRDASSPGLMWCCYDAHQKRDPEFLQWLRKNAKYTMLVSMDYMNSGNHSNWSVRGNIVGGLPYFKIKKSIEQEKKEEEERARQEQERIRQEQEYVRQEEERVRQEQERVKREEEERVRREQERVREEQERLRREEEERVRKENEVRIDRVTTSDPSLVGSVVVTSNPSGAMVEINGRNVGYTPYKFKPTSSLGVITIAVTLHGYEKITKTVKLDGGTYNVSFSLTRKEEVNDVAGIGYGIGYGSGFDEGIADNADDQLGGLMGGGGNDRHKNVVGIGYGTGFGSIDLEQKNNGEQEREESDTEQWRRFMMGILTGYSFSPKEYGLAGFYLGLIYSTRITKNVVLLNIENNFVIGKHHLDINVPLTVMLQLSFLSLETGVGEDFIWDTDYGGTMFRTGLVVGVGVGRKDYRIFYRLRDVDKHPAHWVGIWLLF